MSFKEEKFMCQEKITSTLLGVAIGDSLGVPFEFKPRSYFLANPVIDMFGYGTHNQKPGVWSDDSALTFCLAEALSVEFKQETLAKYFVKWYKEGYWSATGDVFDIGNTTRNAILRIIKGIPSGLAGGKEEYDNGNGSLMRIMPLLFYVKGMELKERFRIVSEVSALTHAHKKSIISCFYFIEYARLLEKGHDKITAYELIRLDFSKYLYELGITDLEVKPFERLLKSNIFELSVDEIKSGGYVIHTLEASIWCFINSKSYSDSVLLAVNLGEDTDTVAAITGGLAGLYYGLSGIPDKWLSKVSRRGDIENLAFRLKSNLEFVLP